VQFRYRPTLSLAWSIALLLGSIILLPVAAAIACFVIPDNAGEAAIDYAGIIAIGYIVVGFVAVCFSAGSLAMNFERSRTARALLIVLVRPAAAGLIRTMFFL
jgi:hypothetical protein